MQTDCAGTVRKICRKIPGKCGETAMLYLCELVQSLDVAGWLIDLGTYEGRSAMVMAMGSVRDGYRRKIVTIDNYQEGPSAKDNEGPYPDVFVVQQRFK